MNNSAKILIPGALCTLAAFILAGCKKIEPKLAVNESPVFYVSGLMDNSPFSIEAGNSGYYMDADYELDATVFQFNAYLKKVCTGCSESLNIKLRSYKEATQAGDLYIDSVFNKGDYIFYDAFAANYSYQVQFTNFSTGAGLVSHAWGFGDGTFSTEANPVKKYATGKKYNVTHVASYSSGCVSDLSYEVNPVTPHDAGFKATPIDSTTFHFTVDSTSTSSTWDFGDGKTGSGDNITHAYDQAGKYKVCLTQSKGINTLQACQNIVSSNINSCLANFHFTSVSPDTSINLHLSEVIIEWKDANGILFSSKDLKQGAGTYFKILGSSPWLQNSKGQTTRKFDFETTCTLTDGTRQIRLSGVHGTLAVAVP